MLGRLRRTTRLDVGLVLGFAGVAYLIWVLVAGTAREMVQAMIRAVAAPNVNVPLPDFTRAVKVFFVDFGFAIDVAGLVWLLLSLVLVLYCSRQRISASWAWASAICQSLVAALGGVVVGYAMNLPYRAMVPPGAGGPEATALERVSELSLPVILTVSILLWVTALVWLLIEYARYKHRGPSLSDGLRTNLTR